jgi:hypothetical protein
MVPLAASDAKMADSKTTGPAASGPTSHGWGRVRCDAMRCAASSEISNP